MKAFISIMGVFLALLISLPAHAQTPPPTSDLILTWKDNSDNEDNFNLERADNPNGPWIQFHQTGPNVQTYKDSGLQEGKLFCYRLNASNSAGASAYTNSMCATTNATLTVLRAGGDAAGRVTSSPAGLDCGLVCTGKVPGGVLITLVATPNPGYVFTGWSGPCSGIGTCDVQMNGTRTVTANFTKAPAPQTPLTLEIKGICTVPGECMINLIPILPPAPLP
jgi:uncharacterized repeat protein (TIGR02543 family)